MTLTLTILAPALVIGAALLFGWLADRADRADKARDRKDDDDEFDDLEL